MGMKESGGMVPSTLRAPSGMWLLRTSLCLHACTLRLLPLPTGASSTPAFRASRSHPDVLPRLIVLSLFAFRNVPNALIMALHTVTVTLLM